MKKVFSFIVLLLGVVAINAQVRKETFKNVFVANAAMASRFVCRKRLMY